MIVQCSTCNKRFDDEFRDTICPHGTFPANDGQNNFRHHPDSYLECGAVEDLIAFEQDIAAEFNAGKIRAPIHLDGGNEQQLIEIFKNVRPQDWICGSWRMHYKCILKGVPPTQLKQEIMAGRSITLCFPEYRIISSAIVGGIIPIALGLAAAIKRRGGDEKVWCFLGDMTAWTGIFHECVRYGVGHDIVGDTGTFGDIGGPLRLVIEDNGKSVGTPTQQAWGTNWTPQSNCSDEEAYSSEYVYELPWPHSGVGKRVEF